MALPLFMQYFSQLPDAPLDITINQRDIVFFETDSHLVIECWVTRIDPPTCFRNEETYWLHGVIGSEWEDLSYLSARRDQLALVLKWEALTLREQSEIISAR